MIRFKLSEPYEEKLEQIARIGNLSKDKIAEEVLCKFVDEYYQTGIRQIITTDIINIS